MKLLYIAGPYRGETINEIYNNISEARRRMEWAWLHGWTPLCPHTNSAFTDGLVPDAIILAGYIEIVTRCDAILLGEWGRGWKASSGSVDEFIAAEQCRLEIIHDPLVRIVSGTGKVPQEDSVGGDVQLPGSNPTGDGYTGVAGSGGKFRR